MDSILEFNPGTIIDDRYEIIERIGVGGFAAVYKARHVRMDRIAAIKIMSTKLLGEDETYVERFIREAQIGANLNHPNALTFYDFGIVEDTGQPYIAMEFLNGHDLHKELKTNGPMDKARVFKLFMPVLEALSCGHAKGIIHRDLKPENLFIVEPGTPNETMKVMDFGISKIQNDSRERLTAEGKILGTLSYFAPEYIQDQLVVPAGDVYQMALIISEALTGNPSNANKSAAALYAHLKGELNICEFLKTGRVGEAFERAYCVDVNKRYQNCGEFAEALKLVKDDFIDSPPLEISDSAVRAMFDVTEEMHRNVTLKKPAVTSKRNTQSKMLKRVSLGLGGFAVVIFGIIMTVVLIHSGNSSSGDESNVAVQDAVKQPVKISGFEKLEDMLTVDELERLKVLNWLPVRDELDEIKELWESAKKGNIEASESLARHYLQLPTSREHYQLAHKALSLSANHSRAMARADHARLGLQIMNSEHRAFLDEVQYDHYIEDILSAIEAGYKPTIFAVLGLNQSDVVRSMNRMNEIRNSDLELYLQERSADWERVRYSLIFNPKHISRIIQGVYRLNNSILHDTMDDDEVMQWSLVLNRLKLLSILPLSAADAKMLNDIRKGIETRIRNDAKSGLPLAQMLLAVTSPEMHGAKILSAIMAAADKGNPRALCIMTDLYMQVAQPETVSGELSLLLNAKVAAAMRARTSASKENIYAAIERYLNRMTDGSCTVDIVRFYQKLDGVAKADESFENTVLDYLFINAAHSSAPRKACDNIMSRLKYDPRKGIPEDVFPKHHAKIYEEASKCYMRALFDGIDYPQSEWKLEADSSAQILYQISQLHKDEAHKDFNLALMIYSAMYGDGILAGYLAMRYRDGDGVPKDDDRMRFWAARAVDSSQCKRCQSDLYQMNMCDVCVESTSMAK